MFACAHPAIEVGVRAPLMLQVVLGLDAKMIASAHENCAGFDSVQESRRFDDELSQLTTELRVVDRLHYFSRMTESITGSRHTQSALWHVIELFPDAALVKMRGFEPAAFGMAKQFYDEVEKEHRGSKNMAVLVSTASLEELRQSFPNFFADTEEFIGRVFSYSKG